MAHGIAVARNNLSFSRVNRIARNVPTREIARVIASNKQLQNVVVDEELDIEKKRSVYDAIHGNKSVQELTFDGVNPFVVRDGLRRLCQMKRVKEVNLLRITVTEPLTLFQPTRSLCTLNVTGGNIGDAVAQAVGRLLRFRSCLRTLVFVKCGLSIDGIVAIRGILQRSSNMKELSMIYDRSVILGNRATEALAQGIEMNTSVESIFLTFPQVSETEGKRIFQAIRVNTTLKQAGIILRNELGREEAVETARLIKENSTLEGISLVSRSAHIDLIANALAENHSLREFRCVRTDTNGIRCVCDALVRNNSIKSFGIATSQITGDGITPLCDMLSSDSSALKGLAFDGCTIEDSSYVALGKALHQNGSLEELIVRPGNVTDRGVRALLDGVKVHPTLKKVEISPLSNPSYQDEIDFYMERNTRAKPILDANALPLSIWPHVLKRANDCRRLVAPNMLYFFVKEKCELFQRAPSSRKRKRTTNA